jgi:hypothetical protein
MRRLLPRITVVALLVACAVPALARAASPAELLASILAAGRAQHSVHYLSVAGVDGSRIVQVADVGATSGIQRITFSRGGRTGHVVVIVSSSRAFRGDAFVLATYMGLHADAATKYANTWILIPQTDRLYGTVAADVTLASTISTLGQPGKPRAAPSRTIHGQRVVGVQWRTVVAGKPVVTALYARAVGTRLPVEERAVRGADSVSVSFSRWNEPLRVQAPSSAVPISRTGLE